MLDYEPYVLTVFQTDAEWTRNRSQGNDPFRTVRDDIDDSCRKYRDRVAENFQRLQKSWELSSELRKELDPTLFTAHHFSIFGIADQLSMALFDDFDPCHAIAAEMKTGLADLTIAMCPKGFNSIGLASAKELLQLDPMETPLLAFTKLKLDGVGILAAGTEFQKSVFDVMASKINGAIHSPVNRDINCGRFVLLDLLGSEEVGLLMLTNNYSCAMSAVFACRSIRYNELSNFKSLNFERVFCREDLSVAQNHVFSGSRTILGVRAQETGPIGDVSKVFGKVTGQCRITVPAGHIDNALEDVGRLESDTISPVLEDVDVQFVSVGSDDFVINFGQQDESKAGRVVETKHAIHFVAKLIEALQSSQNGKEWRNVVEMITDLQVPVPRTILSDCRAAEGHSANVLTILNTIRRATLFELASLRQTTRTKGVPVVLRRMIEHLYQTVVLRLTDPLSWESMLDSIDVLRVFYEFLTETKMHPTVDPFHFMSNSSVDEIAEILTALDSIISHRVAKPFSLFSDMALDYRGGLQQLVYASSAMTMLGSLLWQGFVGNDNVDRKTRIGLATRIQIAPGLTVKFYVNVTNPLAVIKADVPHILDIATYPDFFHEVAHLIFDSIKRRDWKLESLDERSDEFQGEVFAHFFTLRHLFEGDSDLFVTHYLNTFFTQEYGDGYSAKQQTDDLLFKLSAVFDQMFVASAIQDWAVGGFTNTPDLSDMAFRSSLQRYSRFFRDPQNRWSDFREVMTKFFEKRFKRTRKAFQQNSNRFLKSIRNAISTIDGILNQNQELSINFEAICSVLRNYVAFLNQNDPSTLQLEEQRGMPFFDVSRKCDFFLHRLVDGEKKAEITFPTDRNPPSHFLVDIGAGGSTNKFCVIPSARAARMSLQCQSIKKIWSCAAKLRRDKFAELASQFGPECS